MSGIHIRGFLNAAEHALDEAIQLGKKPFVGRKELNYFKSPYIQMWVDRPVRRGGGTVFKTDQGRCDLSWRKLCFSIGCKRVSPSIGRFVSHQSQGGRASGEVVNHTEPQAAK